MFGSRTEELQKTIWTTAGHDEALSGEDTSFNVGTNDVAVDIKVDSDELSLNREEKQREPLKGGSDQTKRRLRV